MTMPMRLRTVAVSLLAITASTRFANHATAQTSPLASKNAQAPSAGSRLNTSGLSRFELQRLLNDLDERRRRLRSAIEPADSVLRLLSVDTARLIETARPPETVQDSARVRRLFLALRQNPSSQDLRNRLADAIETAADNLVSIEQSLKARVTNPDNARDFTERSLYAAVVPFARVSPPSNTLLALTVSRPDTTVIPWTQLAGFNAAISDSTFNDYKSRLLEAYAIRMGDVRLLTKSDRDEVAHIQQDAAQVSRELGQRDDYQAKLDLRVLTIGVPVVAAAVVLMLLVPLLYSSHDLRRAIISSGLLVEMTTVFLLVAAVIILGIDGRIEAGVIGTVLGGLSGYVLGRSIHPLQARNGNGH
jgi:hypothetical protein